MDYPSLVFEKDFFLQYSSKNTRRSYQQDLKFFANFIEKNFPMIKETHAVNRHMALAFKTYLESQALQFSPNTIYRRMTSLKTYYDYLIQYKEHTNNPFSGIKRPKQIPQMPSIPLDRHLTLKLFQLALETPVVGKMHRALLAAYFTTGLRREELRVLRKKDLMLLKGVPYFRVLAKGGSPHFVEIIPLLEEALADHFKDLEQKGLLLNEQAYLFSSAKSRYLSPLHPSTINQIFDRYAKAIGVSRLTPHSARATFINDLLDNGLGIREVALKVNHKSTSSTEVYDRRRKYFSGDTGEKLGY